MKKRICLSLLFFCFLTNTSSAFAVDVNTLEKERRIAQEEMPPEVSQKKHTLKGVVLDNNTNEPIIGAAILVTGTGSGTTTDIDGNYQLEVPANAKSIEISYIGYEKKVMPFDGRNLNDFRVILLKEEGLSVDEVTIVAFSKQKKESVISSIATVKPKELKVPSSNFTTALAGRVAGLISYQRSGEPGQDNANFFIRGVTTFGYKADPLILIDGVELSADDLARLQPDDIESFSIMKDATLNKVSSTKNRGTNMIYTTVNGASEVKEVGDVSFVILDNVNINSNFILEDLWLPNSTAFEVLKSPSKTYESTDLPHGLRRDIDTIYRDIDNRVHIHLTPSAEPVYKSFISYGEKTVEIFPSVNQVVIEDMPLAGTLSLVTSVLPEGEDTKLFYSEKSLFDIGKIICDR